MARIEEAEIVSLAAAVAGLEQLEAKALQRRWRALTGGAIPAGLGRALTLRVLAYKLQAQHLGDLDRQSLRELAAMSSAAKSSAAKEDGQASDDLAGSASTESPPAFFAVTQTKDDAKVRASGPKTSFSPPRIARPGTLLVREHGGVLHRVMIMDAGVTWNGKTFESLSQAAFAITGTKWNGPRFFGLRDKAEDAVKTQDKPQTGKAAGPAIKGRGRAAHAGRFLPQRASP